MGATFIIHVPIYGQSPCLAKPALAAVPPIAGSRVGTAKRSASESNAKKDR